MVRPTQHVGHPRNLRSELSASATQRLTPNVPRRYSWRGHIATKYHELKTIGYLDLLLVL